MNLLPNSLREKIPSSDSETHKPLKDLIAAVRFFDQTSSWEWYVVEFDQQETFWGVVTSGNLALLGNFTLSELECIESSGEKTVVRDEEFQPKSILELAGGNSVILDLLHELEAKMESLPSDLISLE